MTKSKEQRRQLRLLDTRVTQGEQKRICDACKEVFFSDTLNRCPGCGSTDTHIIPRFSGAQKWECLDCGWKRIYSKIHPHCPKCGSKKTTRVESPSKVNKIQKKGGKCGNCGFCVILHRSTYAAGTGMCHGRDTSPRVVSLRWSCPLHKQGRPLTSRSVYRAIGEVQQNIVAVITVTRGGDEQPEEDTGDDNTETDEDLDESED
jgi:RNA polymerase subunit RPABC4/transcription elongation factor Spt4